MKAIDTYSDSELLLILEVEFNPRAFEVIYNRYFPAVFRYTYKIMQDRNASEDLVQNIFVGLWRNKEKTSIENLKAYLFGAARNQIAKHFRRGKFNSVQLEFSKDWEVTHNTEEYLAAMDTRESIEQVVSKLPSKCRQAFELSRFSSLSNKEIAVKMGISVFTVENHIKRALFYLRQSFQLVILLIFIR